MKPKHKAGYRQAAQAWFQWAKLNPGQDFHTLSSSQVEMILVEADRAKYQKPKFANGSRARYFYERLQRHATLKD